MLKFSCVQCGQHISCDDQWSGQQIPCPACGAGLVVPPAEAPRAAPVLAPNPVSAQPPAPARPRLSAGVTQAPRAAAPGSGPRPQRVARPPKTDNPLLKWAVIGVLLAAAAWVAVNYLPGLWSQVTETGAAKPSATTSGQAGPMGEVNGAMDVSDALDGNATPAPRANPKPASRTGAKAATNSPAGTGAGRGK